MSDLTFTDSSAALNPSAGSVVVVSGLSGAGHSTALKALEDVGYQAVANVPLALLGTLVSEFATGKTPVRAAVAIDSRTQGFSVTNLAEQLDNLRARQGGPSIRFLYVKCDDDGVLLRRYTESRRPHPMAGEDRTLREGIDEERWRHAGMTALADIVIDTSRMSVHDLKRAVIDTFADKTKATMQVCVMSFSYKEGVPPEADLMFDMRCFKNPHWEPSLRAHTGESADVQAYINSDADFVTFIDGIKGVLKPALPLYQREGKSTLTIATGCTGGKHRSVYSAILLHDWIKSQGYSVTLRHRDMPTSTPDASQDALIEPDRGGTAPAKRVVLRHHFANGS